MNKFHHLLLLIRLYGLNMELRISFKRFYRFYSQIIFSRVNLFSREKISSVILLSCDIDLIFNLCEKRKKDKQIKSEKDQRNMYNRTKPLETKISSDLLPKSSSGSSKWSDTWKNSSTGHDHTKKEIFLIPIGINLNRITKNFFDF